MDNSMIFSRCYYKSSNWFVYLLYILVFLAISSFLLHLIDFFIQQKPLPFSPIVISIVTKVQLTSQTFIFFSILPQIPFQFVCCNWKEINYFVLYLKPIIVQHFNKNKSPIKEEINVSKDCKYIFVPFYFFECRNKEA